MSVQEREFGETTAIKQAKIKFRDTNKNFKILLFTNTMKDTTEWVSNSNSKHCKYSTLKGKKSHFKDKIC